MTVKKEYTELTKKELIIELEKLRQRVDLLKETEHKRKLREEALLKAYEELEMRKELQRSKSQINEGQLGLAVDAPEQGMWDWNVKTGEIQFSQQWVEILGYSPGEIRSHISAWQEIVHPEDMPQVMEILNANLEGLSPFFECEHRLRAKSGEWKWILARGKVVERDSHGKPLRHAGSYLDINQRAIAQRAAQKSHDEMEQRLAELADELMKMNERLQEETEHKRGIEEALHISTQELKIRNKILEIFLKIPDDQAYDKLLKLFLEVFESQYGTFGYFDQEGNFVVPSMTRDVYWEKCQVPDKEIIFLRGTFSGIWARALAERKVLYSNKGPFNTPKGHIPIINTMVAPIIYRDKIISTIHIANKRKGYTEGDKRFIETIANQLAPVLNARLERDRHERIRIKAEEDLKNAVDIANAAETTAKGGSWRWELATDRLVASKNLYRIHGIKPEDFGQKFENGLQFVHPDDIEEVKKGIQEMLSEKKPRIFHYRIVTPGGIEKDLECTNRMTFDENGTITEISGMIQDITERKRVEKQLKDYARTQEVLVKELNHRVKNNLTAILGMLQIEEDSLDNKENTSLFRLVHNIKGRIEGLLTVQTLLSASGWQPLELQLLCEEVVGAVVKSHQVSKKTEVNVSASEVRVDIRIAHYLALVLNELAVNSIKYAMKQRDLCRIGINAEVEAKRVILCYRDNGPGFPEEIIRADSPAAGTGLWLVHGIVTHSLGGDVRFSNDNGAAVTLVLENMVYPG